MKDFKFYEWDRHRSSQIKNEAFEIDVQIDEDSRIEWSYWKPLAISERTRRFTK